MMIRMARSAVAESRLTAPPDNGTTLPQFGRGRIAQTREQVIEAWRLVYEVYVQTGLIEPNPYRVHAWPQALSQRAAAFFSGDDLFIESTLTAVDDGPAGLPLDSVYHDELNRLRHNGCHLMEVGLFAHIGQCRQPDDPSDAHVPHAPQNQMRRMRQSLVTLMGMAFYFGQNRGVTDFVIGVHPRHASFYRRSWGCLAVAPERTYAAVNHRPVVLLRCDWQTAMRWAHPPYALAHWVNNPLPMTLFDARYLFGPDADMEELQPMEQAA